MVSKSPAASISFGATQDPLGVILSAGDSLTWLSEVTAQPLPQLLAQINDEDRHKIWPIFHPYLSGERTPHNIAEPRGGFFGLSRADNAGDLTRSVLQGVSFAIADAMDVLDDSDGKPKRIIATGGGAKNSYWLSLIASVTGCRIAVPEDADVGAALGAARLGMLADGIPLEEVCRKPAISHTVCPDDELRQHLHLARELSQKLFALTDIPTR